MWNYKRKIIWTKKEKVCLKSFIFHNIYIHTQTQTHIQKKKKRDTAAHTFYVNQCLYTDFNNWLLLVTCYIIYFEVTTNLISKIYIDKILLDLNKHCHVPLFPLPRYCLDILMELLCISTTLMVLVSPLGCWYRRLPKHQ